MWLWPRIARSFSSVKSVASGNYVKRMKVLDNWKINDSAVASQFETSEMVLMIDQRPLIVKSPEGPRLFVGTTQRIREALDDFGLVVSIRNSVLLDALPDEGDKCKALFGCSVLTLEPPHDSRISADEPRKRLAGVLGASLIPLRLAMLTMPMEQDRNWVARMQSLTKWSKIYNYCPKCSSLLRMRQSKSGASCGQCNRIYYPTVSPVAICLIRDKENEHCLLVRHLASMNGIFTTVAGFAEAGESLEEAVRREIAEEVGIECEDVRYMGMSQAWPMPNSSLMSAFSAVASRTDELSIAPDELYHAGWFSRQQVLEAIGRTERDRGMKAMLANKGEPNQLQFIPPAGAIAHQMIKNWAQQKS